MEDISLTSKQSLSADAAAFVPGKDTKVSENFKVISQSSSLENKYGEMAPRYVYSCYPFIPTETMSRTNGCQPHPEALNTNLYRLPPPPFNRSAATMNPLFLQKPPPLNSNQMAFMSSFQSFPNRAVYEMPLVNGATPVMGGTVPVINNSIPQPQQVQMLSNIQQPVVYQSMPFSSPPPIPTNFPLTQNPNVQWMDKSFHCVPGVFAPPPLQPELQQPAINQSGHLKTNVVGETNAKKSGPRTKVIICKDISVQTDFNEKLSLLTLAECPNTLYDNNNTEDAAGIESDSGYSSPLHRKRQQTMTDHPNVSSNVSHPSTSCVASQPNLPRNVLFSGQQQQVFHQQAFHQQNAQVFGSNGVRHQIPISLLPPPNSVPLSYNLSGLPRQHISPLTCHPMFPMFNNVNFPNLRVPHFDPSRRMAPPAKSVTKKVNNWHPQRSHQNASTSSKLSIKLAEGNDTRTSQNAGVEAGGADLSFNNTESRSSSSLSRPLVSSGEDVLLHFEDEDEFPNLLSAAGGLVDRDACFDPKLRGFNSNNVSKFPLNQPGGANRFSSMMGSEKRRTLGQLPGNNLFPGKYNAYQYGNHIVAKDSKLTKKKQQKRQLLANQAAEEELAEILLEQQVLREMSLKQQKKLSSSSSKTLLTPTTCSDAAAVSPAFDQHSRSQMPTVLDLAQIIGELEKQNSENGSERNDIPAHVGSSLHENEDKSKVPNSLDSSAPIKRGKEREVPKPKKPSSLKKVILKEREEKKRYKTEDEADDAMTDDATTLNMEEDKFQDESSDMTLVSDTQTVVDEQQSQPIFCTPNSVEDNMSPLSQMSPLNISPLSGASPGESGGTSPIAGDGTIGSGGKTLSKIHSRRFREYCSQVLDKEIDDCCTSLLQDLVRFQDRLYHKDPSKAKSKKRFVLGLREVTKHLKLGKLKCVIISPNLERIQSKGGLDDALNTIIELCQLQDVPFVFALGRRALGRACAKLVPVSVVGVFSYEGTEENFYRLKNLTRRARDAYIEMVATLETEVPAVPLEVEAAEVPSVLKPLATSNCGGFEKLFPHLGHSRTPSACSAISFVSSILSEPISENYPQSEPETDSRGYEINKENKKPDLDTVGEGWEEPVEVHDGVEKDKTLVREDFDDDDGGGEDDGHEADTEDDAMISKTENVGKEKTKMIGSSLQQAALAGPVSAFDVNKASDVSLNAKLTSAKSALGGFVEVEELIGKQISSVEPDLDLNRTLSKTISNSRIESWVVESQRAIEEMRQRSMADIIDDAENGGTSVEPGENEESDGAEEEEDVDDDVEEEECDDGDDKAGSVKTNENESSISEYEDTCEVLDHQQIGSQCSRHVID